MDKYEALKLKNQICFPLYAASRQVVKKYRPLLKKLDLTYTQYITLLALWEYEKLSVKELGEMLFLDSGTLTPLLKSLEKKGFLSRKRSNEDERFLEVTITDKGLKLRDAALNVPSEIAGCMDLSESEAINLYNILYKIIG